MNMREQKPELLLLVDTCSSEATAALARLGPTCELVDTAELPPRGVAEFLLPQIATLLEGQSAILADVTAIAVTTGPGSFTGIRLGLSCIKGLAYAASLPVAAFSRLAVLAHVAQTGAAVQDAGRGQLYVRVGAVEALGSPAQAVEMLKDCPGVACCELSARNLLAGFEVQDRLIQTKAPQAKDILELMLARMQQIKDGVEHWNDLATLDGNYLRRSDAELFAHKS